MRSNKCVKLVYLASKAPVSGRTAYDFNDRGQSATQRCDRVRALEHENALLEAVVSQTRADIMRLRQLIEAVD